MDYSQLTNQQLQSAITALETAKIALDCRLKTSMTYSGQKAMQGRVYKTLKSSVIYEEKESLLRIGFKDRHIVHFTQTAKACQQDMDILFGDALVEGHEYYLLDKKQLCARVQIYLADNAGLWTEGENIKEVEGFISSNITQAKREAAKRNFTGTKPTGEGAPQASDNQEGG